MITLDLQNFDRHMEPREKDLGSIQDLRIESTVGPFHTLPDYVTAYPAVVIQALGNLYAEYNAEFGPLAEQNREWSTDYRYCMLNGKPVNWGVQIDMIGLPEEYLAELAVMSEPRVREILRRRVFEFENSIAMYQLLERVCVQPDGTSRFQIGFRRLLDEIRGRFNMPIALLAVTDQKYQAMLESEFGKTSGPISDEEVRKLSGFDHFFSPSGFSDHVGANNGECKYLLFARTSDPLSKLRKPNTEVVHPLLSNSRMREIIKAYSITFNVDNPELTTTDPRRINDTKGYMAPMRMAFSVKSQSDFLTPPFEQHLSNDGDYSKFTGERLQQSFARFLMDQGVDPALVASGQAKLRCKPAVGTYGCYGHHSGSLTDRDFRKELRKSMRERGRYVVQPEMKIPAIINKADGRKYLYIDRNWMGYGEKGAFFIGGYRSLMPADTFEAHEGRVHGNGSTVWAEIIAAE